MPDKRDDMEEMEPFGSEATNSERMRRMKQLMRQIYQEENLTVKPVKLPPIKLKTLIVAVSMASVLILGTTMLWNFNRFTTAEEHVLSAMGHINDALQRRSNLFRNLINLTLNQAALEQEIFRHTADARAGMVTPPPQLPAVTSNPPAAAATEGGDAATNVPNSAAALLSATGLPRLLAVAEQHPDLKAATTYQQLMDKMVVSENLIFERRDDYNEKVRIYNTMITVFPWWFMAKLTGFKRYPYFVTDVGPDHRMLDLTPETFIRLLPVQSGMTAVEHLPPRKVADPQHKSLPQHKAPIEMPKLPAGIPPAEMPPAGIPKESLEQP
ncbi:MAG: LemA family protein [Magnetococcales bacterium]|nr:LemA family protein [Magnetococcales bacterium]